MSTAFDSRTHCAVGIRPVHRSEPIQASGFEAEVSKLKQRVCEVEAENAQLRENHGGEISEN